LVKADLVLFDGYFLSPREGKPVGTSLAIGGGLILAVGDEKAIKPFVGKNTHVIDLEGRVVLPGLSDAHVHGLSLGRRKNWVDLSEVSSISELVEELKRHSSSLGPGEWVIGFGWDHERFLEHRPPTKDDLDLVSRDRPVVAFRKCWHLCSLNSKALEALGDKLEGLLREGLAQSDLETGEPTGILVGEGLEAIREAMPEPTEREILGAVQAAVDEALSKGLTCLHWIAERPEELSIIMALRALGQLRIRLYILFPARMMEHLLALGLRSGFGDPWVRVGAVKLILDGSLGARTAFLREPYSDEPGERGRLLYSEEELTEIALRAHRAGLQLAIHAIGDGAVESALKALSGLPGGPGRMRHRIEHASVLDPGLIKMMASLGVVASVQPRFIASDFWVEERLGPHRARWTYPFKSMLEAGVVLAAGSDAPVEPIDPLEGIRAAVGEAQRPEERLTIWEALTAYTYGPAYASFQEGFSGSIGPGRVADLTVLSCGPEGLPETILEAEVDATFVCGKLAYSRTELLELA